MAKEKEAAVAEDVKKEVRNIHELSWVEGKGWAVKRQSSDKVIKYFKTKLEGIEYIMKISENTKTHIVIKLKNGKFQKFDNAVRALKYAKENKEEA